MSLFRPLGKGPGRFQVRGRAVRCAGCDHDVFCPAARAYQGWALACDLCGLVAFFDGKIERTDV